MEEDGVGKISAAVGIGKGRVSVRGSWAVGRIASDMSKAGKSWEGEE